MIRNVRLAMAYLRYTQVARDRRRRPCLCNATARAMRYVQHQWVVAGIDKGE